MKKKLKLKKWVEYTLLVINFLMLMIMGSDYGNLAFFTISHLIALLVFMLNSYVLSKYTDLFVSED